MAIREVFETIESRKTANPEQSYVASLFEGGCDKILKKVAEEAGEVIIASKNGEREPLARELCDLLFHSLVLMSHHGIDPDRIEREMERRFGVSGLEEKKNRGCA